VGIEREPSAAELSIAIIVHSPDREFLNNPVKK
jgi:hypothetical protein